MWKQLTESLLTATVIISIGGFGFWLGTLNNRVAIIEQQLEKNTQKIEQRFDTLEKHIFAGFANLKGDIADLGDKFDGKR